MNSLAVVEKEQYTETEINLVSFNYANNLSVKKLLDNIAAIIADEYIEKAKQNPEFFLDIGGKE
jgi:S-adenosylmethionine:tRNA-ribosyltransferase-isomerase (queuine synthetase)